MRLEQRGRVEQPHRGFNWRQEETRDCGKAFHHPERAGIRSFLAVKANAGSAGVDKETIEDFERDLKGNLY